MAELLLSNEAKRFEVWEEETGVSLKVGSLLSVFVCHQEERHNFTKGAMLRHLWPKLYDLIDTQVLPKTSSLLALKTKWEKGSKVIQMAARKNCNKLFPV